MKNPKHFKKLVREHMARTGRSYMSAMMDLKRMREGKTVVDPGVKLVSEEALKGL